MHHNRQSADLLSAHWRRKCTPGCKTLTALAVFVYVFGLASLAAAEQWWVMRDSATAVCLAEEATEQPQFGSRWKGPFADEATALESLCQNLNPADGSKCVAVIPEGQCTKSTNRTFREAPVRNSDRATEAQTFSLKNVFPPREPPPSPPPPEVKSWIWDLGCHCEWDQTCSGDPSFAFPTGFVYCKHSATETSNTGDGNSNWWMGSTRPDRISVHVECAGSYAFFDRWGSWVGVHLDFSAIDANASNQQRQAAGCSLATGGSAACSCTRSSQKATEDCYTVAGGTCIAHLDEAFSLCVDTAQRCSERGVACANSGGTLMFFPQNKICI